MPGHDGVEGAWEKTLGMRRRAFIALIGGAAASAWPRAAHAQRPAIPVVGFLRNTSFASATHLVTAFRHGLKEAGFVEGQNVAIEFRSAEGQNDRLSSLIAELILRPVAVIVGNSLSALPAKAATTTVPIVFVGGGDPVALGLVTSINRPGGNVTGVNFLAGVLGSKRLELLSQLVPKAATIGFLVHPNTVETEAERKDVLAAAQALGRQLIVLDVSSEHDLETAFATLVRGGAGAVFVGTGNYTFSNRERIVALAVRHALPASSTAREAAVAGALMSYGPSITDAYREGGIQVGRILKGAKPADVPVMQSSKFEFVVNLKTAKTLGLEFHPQLLAITDEAIE